MQDRRRHTRKDRSYPVEYCTVDRGERERGAVPTTTVNLSEGGLAIVAKSPLRTGGTLSLELKPDPQQRPVLAIGRVAFCREEGGEWVAGLELCWVDGGAFSPDAAVLPQMNWSFL